MIKLFPVFIAVLAFGACQTYHERLAKRVSCKPKTVVIKEERHMPGYTEWDFTCDGHEWTCSDKPYYSNCKEIPIPDPLFVPPIPKNPKKKKHRSRGGQRRL